MFITDSSGGVLLRLVLCLVGFVLLVASVLGLVVLGVMSTLTDLLSLRKNLVELCCRFQAVILALLALFMALFAFFGLLLGFLLFLVLLWWLCAFRRRLCGSLLGRRFLVDG